MCISYSVSAFTTEETDGTYLHVTVWGLGSNKMCVCVNLKCKCT